MRGLLALRVNYVGELGWELHAPVEQMASDLRPALAGGRDARHPRLRHVRDGFAAAREMLSRLEDRLTHEYTPLHGQPRPLRRSGQAGDFVGRDALLREHNSGPRGTAACRSLLDDAGDGRRALLRVGVAGTGRSSASSTSGGYGHALGKSIALAYVRTDLAKPGTALDVEIFGERRRAVVAQEPLYDPTNARLRM